MQANKKQRLFFDLTTSDSALPPPNSPKTAKLAKPATSTAAKATPSPAVFTPQKHNIVDLTDEPYSPLKASSTILDLTLSQPSETQSPCSPPLSQTKTGSRASLFSSVGSLSPPPASRTSIGTSKPAPASSPAPLVLTPAPKSKAKTPQKSPPTSGNTSISPGNGIDEEKRLMKYRPHASGEVIVRISRVMSQRMYLIKRLRPKTPDVFEEDFQILGTTGNTYTVRINALPSCDCPDFQQNGGQQPCKHLLFVWLKVLKMDQSNPMIWQGGLLKKELEKAFDRETNPSTLIGNDAAQGAVRKPIGGDCPVCYEALTQADEANIIWCQGKCGNNIHKDCWKRWEKTQRKHHMAIVCLYCRTAWKPFRPMRLPGFAVHPMNNPPPSIAPPPAPAAPKITKVIARPGARIVLPKKAASPPKSSPLKASPPKSSPQPKSSPPKLSPPKVTSTPKKATPKKSPGLDAEKRLSNYRRTPSGEVKVRIMRVMSQRMFLVDRTKLKGANCNEEDFKILGTTGNLYTVRINQLPSCDCPDFAKHGSLQPCKHLLFVWLKVLKLGQSDPIIWQTSLLKSELEKVFLRETDPSVLAAESVRALVRGDNNDQAKSAKSAVVQKPIEGDCPICYEKMKASEESKIVWCRGLCGNNVHTQCWNTWEKLQKKRNQEVVCVYCRAPWTSAAAAAPAAKGKKRAKPLPVGEEGYFNLAHLQGVSTERDTSTYIRRWSFD